MTKDITSTSSSKPGKWASIPSLRLPEPHLKLDPRLGELDQNAIARLYILRSGRPLIEQQSGLSRFMSGLGDFSWAMLKALFKVPGFFATGGAFGVFLLYLISGIWMAVVVAVLILACFISYAMRAPLDYFKILGKHLNDLRPLPLSGLDYAIAHWGGNMLHDSFSRQFPANALYRCCHEMEQKLEACTGWTYYPSTFRVKFSDGVERGEIILEDEDGRAVLKDQFSITSDVFTYSGRLDYLAALWREYLEVWWPDQPWEGEARRAALPSRARRAAEAGRVV